MFYLYILNYKKYTIKAGKIHRLMLKLVGKNLREKQYLQSQYMSPRVFINYKGKK